MQILALVAVITFVSPQQGSQAIANLGPELTERRVVHRLIHSCEYP